MWKATFTSSKVKVNLLSLRIFKDNFANCLTMVLQVSKISDIIVERMTILGEMSTDGERNETSTELLGRGIHTDIAVLL